MVDGYNLELFFAENANKKSFSELSQNTNNGLSLVSSTIEGYDYETLVKPLFSHDCFKMVDAVYFKNDWIYFIEFKGGFIQKINTGNFNLDNWWCDDGKRQCKEAAVIFLKNQELMISQLIESIKGKLLETHAVLHKMILPKCQSTSKKYYIRYVAVVEESNVPVDSLESAIGELGNLPKNDNNSVDKLKTSLKKYDINDLSGQPMFFDSIEVWNTFDFEERIKKITT